MADTKKWKIQNLAIKDLSLWDENSRFPEEYFNKDEKELIQYFLAKKEFKIEDLAKEIVQEFDLPQLERLVVLNIKGKMIVLEGNRRLTVYKLLVNPSLSTGAKVEDFFSGLQSKININDKFKLEVNVTTIKSEGLRFVDRKHNKGNNEVGWNEFERHNHKVRNGTSKNIQSIVRINLGNEAKKLDLPEVMKENILGKGYVTNFYRLIASAPAREIFGYDFTEEGELIIKNKKDFQQKLKVVVHDLLSGREYDGGVIDSRSLNTNDEKKKYFKSISKKDFERVDKEIKKHTRKDLFGKETVDIPRKGKSIYGLKPGKDFDSLVDPLQRLPKVNSQKIKEIYIELQKIKLSETPTAGALLLRALMELTVTEFIHKNLISVDLNGYIRTESGKTKESLKEKIDYLSKNFAPKEIQDTVAIFNGNSIFTENLNKIAHSRYIFSSKQKVVDLWKDSKAFWEFMVEAMIKLESKK